LNSPTVRILIVVLVSSQHDGGMNEPLNLYLRNHDTLLNTLLTKQCVHAPYLSASYS